MKGRDLVVGSPKTVTVSSDEIREALVDQVNIVVDAVKQALERTPPELAADIVDKGIVLAGGGSLLANFDILIRERTGLPVMYAEDPLKCVVIGSGKVLDQLDLLKSLTIDWIEFDLYSKFTFGVWFFLLAFRIRHAHGN